MSEPSPLVLIVDDNPNNLRLLEGLLAEAGYQVRAALGGEAALRAARIVEPDLVLLDIRMPGMDGYEACRRLRTLPSTRDVPIIFISALQDVTDKVRAFRAGGQDYVVKPFQADEVLARVGNYIELSRSRRRLMLANEHLEEVAGERTAALREANARLERAMRQERALRRLLALSHSGLETEEWLRQGLRLLAELFEDSRARRRWAIFLNDRKGGHRQRLVASEGLPPGEIEGCGEEGTSYCLCLQPPTRVHWNEGDAGMESPVAGAALPATCAHLALPLQSGELTLGVLVHAVERATPLAGEEEEFLRQVVDILSITIARRYADERIAYLAFHDDLTGLPNRASLYDRLDTALKRVDGSLCAVLFIDLDHFKQVNDVLGHGAGDSFLRVCAARLSTLLDEEETLCRWGSDEFVVLARRPEGEPGSGRGSIHDLALAIGVTLAQPVTVEGQEIRLNVSIGIALHPGDGNTSEELLRRSELALSRAKQSGRNLIEYYRPEMQGDAVRRMTLGRELRRAVDEEQFLLHYQPQLDASGRLHGAEALVRWRHPERGMVYPGDFIGMAEELGLIGAIGEWVLAAAAGWLVALEGEAERGPNRVAVNVSARQFHDSGFVERCAGVVERAGLAPARVELEVTESLLLADIGGARRKISALREMGFHFSLDDFGTGYSSLAYLKSLPVDKLKIDRSFVTDVHLDRHNAAIVRTIIALAENLGMTPIAEGVEKAEELAYLKESGCHLFQGYYLGKPLAQEAFVETWVSGKQGLRTAPGQVG